VMPVAGAALSWAAPDISIDPETPDDDRHPS